MGRRPAAKLNCRDKVLRSAPLDPPACAPWRGLTRLFQVAAAAAPSNTGTTTDGKHATAYIACATSTREPANNRFDLSSRKSHRGDLFGVLGRPFFHITSAAPPCPQPGNNPRPNLDFDSAPKKGLDEGRSILCLTESSSA